MIIYGDDISVGNSICVFEPGTGTLIKCNVTTVQAASVIVEEADNPGTMHTVLYLNLCDHQWRAQTTALGLAGTDVYTWCMGWPSP